MVRVSLPNGKKKLSPNVVVVFVVVVDLAYVGILVVGVGIIGALVVVVVVSSSLLLVSRVEVAVVAMSVLPNTFVSVVFSVGLLGKPQKKILF